jgi:hypothetical protein
LEAKKNIRVEHDIEASENDKSSSSLSNSALKNGKVHILNSKHYR